jgi:Flp pilus assembly protein TadG
MALLRNLFKRFRDAIRGNVTAATAVAMLPLAAAIGGGVDFSNAISARARLQDAADAAAIAAALDTTGQLSNQQTAADNAFTANIKDSPLADDSPTGSLSVVTENNVQTMLYTGKASVKTFLIGLVGIQTIPLTVTAKAGITMNSAEIAFVLDNTGSMSQNSKMTTLKADLDATLASLADSSGSSGHTKVALIPFDTQVALSDVSGMTGYATNFTTVTQSYTCSGITTAQCSGVTGNMTSLCSYITSSYSSTSGAACATNAAAYTKVSNGYYYVYTTTWFSNPSYNSNCWYYCYNNYKYLTYYRVAAYSLGASTATQSGNSSTQGYYSSYASATTPSNAGYSNYTQYTGTLTYAYPTAGGYSSGSTTVFKDNTTITANSDLLGVGTQNWSGCVIDRTQPYDVQSDAPSSSNTATQYPASKCATNSLLPIMDLTTDISSARTYAQKMTPAGNTNITIGVQWGMEVLSPTAPFTNGAAFTDSTVSKYMIVLTDGLNTQNRWTTTASQIDARTTLACTNAKALGITIFTVRLEDGNSSMLQGCASQTGYYYNLSNASQLSGALGNIMKSIKKIRLTQ